MKQYDCMFIQVNETGYIYHLCYTDNTREVISRARFVELVSQTKYEDDDGVYWFRGNFWMFAETPQEMTMTPYNIGDTVIGSDGYYRVVADGVKGMRLQFDHPFIPGEIVRGEFGDVVQAPRKNIQIACNKCSQGVMDSNNPHLWGLCQCECHQTPHNAPKTNGGKNVVLVHHIDGQQETDADWLARQAELEDYAATTHAASYRGQ